MSVCDPEVPQNFGRQCRQALEFQYNKKGRGRHRYPDFKYLHCMPYFMFPISHGIKSRNIPIAYSMAAWESRLRTIHRLSRGPVHNKHRIHAELTADGFCGNPGVFPERIKRKFFKEKFFQKIPNISGLFSKKFLFSASISRNLGLLGLFDYFKNNFDCCIVITHS